MNDKVIGIVLNQFDYRENDIIIKVLTKEMGVISFVVRGAKKAKSKNNSGCLQFSKSEFLFNYKENKNIFSLKTVTLKKMYFDDDLINISLKSIFTEIIDRTYDLENYFEYYDLLEFCLEHFNENKYLVSSLYLAKVLVLQGINPFVDGCVGCGSKQVLNISSSMGGFVCLECNDSNQIIDIEMLKKFRLINKAELNNYEMIKNINFNKNDFRLIMDFFIYQTNLKINAYDLILNIM
jgi:DNA repair protein RecO (recombination protein O)